MRKISFMDEIKVRESINNSLRFLSAAEALHTEKKLVDAMRITGAEVAAAYCYSCTMQRDNKQDS